MRGSTYILVTVISIYLSCENQPSKDPMMVSQVFAGEANGVPFKTGSTVRFGASVTTDMCNQDVIAMSLIRKIEDDEFAIVHLNFFHTKPGNYVLTDSTNSHRNRLLCTLDSVTTSLSFDAFPGDDVSMDRYRLLEGPWNYLKVLYYDPVKKEMQGNFAAKFVRTNKRQHGREAVDTVSYTNSKFIFSNIHIQQIFTEPR